MPRKQRAKLPPGLVRHPRYGTQPIPSGLKVTEEAIRKAHWAFSRAHLFPETVLIGNPAKQSFSMYPRRFHVDVLRECRTCGRPFIFFAREQRYWYETLRFYVDADCVLCPDCRRAEQTIRRRLRRYSDLASKKTLARKELMNLVDDATFPLATRVLPNPRAPGRPKNPAKKGIPEYRGKTGVRSRLAR